MANMIKCPPNTSFQDILESTKALNLFQGTFGGQKCGSL